MQKVHQIFSNLIGDDEDDSLEADKHYHELWDMIEKPDVIEEIFDQDIASHHWEEMAQTIIGFKRDSAKKTLGSRERQVLNRLMTKVFSATFSHQDAQYGLPRVLHLLHNIATRTMYLELLDEYPATLTQLVHLCIESSMISEQLILIMYNVR